MRDEALALLESLSDDQRAAVFLPVQDRTRWYYTPNDHGGVSIGALTPRQQQRVFALLGAALTPAAYNTVCSIVSLENHLDRVEGFQPPRFGRERGRDPGLYWMAFFGDVDSGTWSWRIGGHHVSIQRTFVDGELVSATPSFLGADPADAPLVGGRWLRPLAAYEDLARELVHAYPAAVVASEAPDDIASGNRPFLSEGDSTMNLAVVMGFGDGEPPAVDPAIPLSRTPRAGVQSPDLQRLVDAYCEQVPGLRIDGSRMRFLWAGGVEKGEPHYYRLQDDDWLIEYDNVQRNVNHIHAVLRSWDGDFGRDVLSAHHALHHGS